MKIGAIADTHMFRMAKELPKTLIEGLQGADLILHAGDWTDPDLIYLLQEIAPVDGVAGNNDGFDIIDKFGRKKILDYEGFRIGVIHGDGDRRSTEQNAFDAFAEDQVDMILFGHSHVPLKLKHQGVLLFNPGSPTDKRRQEEFSFGIIEITDRLSAEHIFYADKSGLEKSKP